MFNAPRTLPAILLLAAFWLLTHRYRGITHDGIYYAGQALARFDATAFRHDLFFAFGSQDDYSVFSLLYGWLAQTWGLERAAFGLLVAAHLAWAAAATFVARQWLGGTAFWIGLALVFALPRAYGPDAIFHYAESFLTARSYAEPLVLAIVAATISGKPRWAWIAAVLAFGCHPIIALPGALFLAIYHSSPGWRSLAIAAVATAALSFALPTMDAEWLALVRLRTPFVLLDEWTATQLLEPLAWLGILAVAAMDGPPRLRRTARALALSGAAGLLLAALGTVSHAAWLIQAQPWRVMWLLKVVALLALAGMFAHRWHRSAADRWLLAGLAASALTAATLGGPAALLLAIIARYGWRDAAPPALPRWLPAAGAIALAAVLIETALAIFQQIFDRAAAVLAGLSSPAAPPTGDWAGLFDGHAAVLLAATLWVVMRMAPRHPRSTIVIAAATLALSASAWQRDRDPELALLFGSHRIKPFADLVPRNATVYWQNDFPRAWFLLRQGNYASTQQSVGLLFSRQTALESRRRLARLAAFGAADAAMGKLAVTTPAASTVAGLAELCRDPLLDFVILDRRLGDVEPARWLDPTRGTPWFLHRCRDFRG